MPIRGVFPASPSSHWRQFACCGAQPWRVLTVPMKSAASNPAGRHHEPAGPSQNMSSSAPRSASRNHEAIVATSSTVQRGIPRVNPRTISEWRRDGGKIHKRQRQVQGPQAKGHAEVARGGDLQCWESGKPQGRQKGRQKKQQETLTYVQSTSISVAPAQSSAAIVLGGSGQSSRTLSHSSLETRRYRRHVRPPSARFFLIAAALTTSPRTKRHSG